MVTQGGSEDKLAVQIRKANIKHPSAFLKYKINNNKMITDIKTRAHSHCLNNVFKKFKVKMLIINQYWW